MKRDIILSLVLHLVVFTMAIVSAPFDSGKVFDYDEVIRIKAVAYSDFVSTTAEPLEPVSIPEVIEEEPAEIPMDKPTTIDDPKPIVKQKKKPDNNQPTKKDNIPTGSENGKKEIDVASTGEGSPFGGATIDNATFDYPYWFTQAFNKIAGNWRQTVVFDGSLICVVYFQVIRSGRMVELRVKQSSGIATFDNTCILAIERSAPFPPLPKEFRDEIIGITLPFKYEPN